MADLHNRKFPPSIPGPNVSVPGQDLVDVDPNEVIVERPAGEHDKNHDVNHRGGGPQVANPDAFQQVPRGNIYSKLYSSLYKRGKDRP